MNAGWILRLGVGLVLLGVLAVATVGCGGGERSLTQMEQPLEGDDVDGDEDGAESPGGDPGVVSLICPEEAVPLKLAIAHEYNYSPNRQTDVYSVNATTDPNAWCMITVRGSQVTADPCNFSYHYEGFTTDGSTVCQIAGDGKAGLEITGQCKDGLLDLQLSEYADDSGLTGKLNCPGVAAIEYGTAYPRSLTEARFGLSSGGDTVTEFTERDVTGQFSFKKTWTLYVPPDVTRAP